jgi:predicted RNase H-like nuclease (RuvC/YqgF family)
VNTGVITAVVSGVVTVTVAVISLISASRAQRTSANTQRAQAVATEQAREDEVARQAAIARAQVEAQAFERARQSYERIVADLEKQLERNQVGMARVQTQLDNVLQRLGQEQEASVTLRIQVQTLQRQVDDLQLENERFRRTIVELQRVAASLRDDLLRAGTLPREGD